MKKTVLSLLIVLLSIACKKDSNTNGYGSIVQDQSLFTNPGGHFIPPAITIQDSLTVSQLMTGNNLATDGFQFYFYESYNAIDQQNQIGFYQIAIARQIRNGLPIFSEDITFGFENGKLNGPAPAAQFIVGTIALDNKPVLSLQALRNIFIKTDNANEARKIGIQDSTLVALLGYYNLNINQISVGGVPNYVKAWYVHPVRSLYPFGFFRDDSGAVMGFRAATSNNLFP